LLGAKLRLIERAAGPERPSPEQGFRDGRIASGGGARSGLPVRIMRDVRAGQEKTPPHCPSTTTFDAPSVRNLVAAAGVAGARFDAAHRATRPRSVFERYKRPSAREALWDAARRLEHGADGKASYAFNAASGEQLRPFNSSCFFRTSAMFSSKGGQDNPNVRSLPGGIPHRSDPWSCTLKGPIQERQRVLTIENQELLRNRRPSACQ